MSEETFSERVRVAGERYFAPARRAIQAGQNPTAVFDLMRHGLETDPEIKRLVAEMEAQKASDRETARIARAESLRDWYQSCIDNGRYSFTEAQERWLQKAFGVFRDGKWGLPETLPVIRPLREAIQ